MAGQNRSGPGQRIGEVQEQGKADHGGHQIFDHDQILRRPSRRSKGPDSFLTNLDESLTGRGPGTAD